MFILTKEILCYTILNIVMFSEIFYTFVITTASGVLLAMIRMLYKSKCKTIKICGCEIDRDTEAEEREDEKEMEIIERNEERKINLQKI